MEFLLVLVIVAAIGGVLGYFAGQKWKPRKTYYAEGSLVGMSLGITIAMILDLSVPYGMAIGIILGEVMGLLIPKNE